MTQTHPPDKPTRPYDKNRSRNILEVLNSQELTAEELANKLGGTYKSVYAALRRLENDGLVTRRALDAGLHTKPPHVWRSN
jgi:Pleiotropic transcriptional repressor